MTQREIPGFYYGKYRSSHNCDKNSAILTTPCTDAEKGKYFRVQANHVAPQGAKYSQENVRKEKEQSRVSLSCFFCLKDLEHARAKVGHILWAPWNYP
jgi:hypothetical protein